MNLVSDGRIHPGRIEDMVEKARKEVDDIIRDAGEQATFEINVHNMHPDLVKILGRLNYRTTVKMFLNILLKWRISLACVAE